MERERSHERSNQIYGWFEIERTPTGDAPDEIRQDWVGVLLPLREGYQYPPNQGIDVGGVVDLDARNLFNSDELVAVDTFDAIIALREADRDNAAKWWLKWHKERQEDTNSPTSGQKLVFLRDEGRALPTDAQDYGTYLMYEREFQPLLYIYRALGHLPQRRASSE